MLCVRFCGLGGGVGVRMSDNDPAWHLVWQTRLRALLPKHHFQYVAVPGPVGHSVCATIARNTDLERPTTGVPWQSQPPYLELQQPSLISRTKSQKGNGQISQVDGNVVCWICFLIIPDVYEKDNRL